MKDKVKLEKIMELIYKYGGTDGGHHKQWIIDQIAKIAVDDYDKFVKEYEDGEDGPNTYEWDKGIPP